MEGSSMSPLNFGVKANPTRKAEAFWDALKGKTLPRAAA